MLHVASVCTQCCMLLRFVANCCAKFETGQMFSYMQTDEITLNTVGQQFWELLRPFAGSFRISFPFFSRGKKGSSRLSFTFTSNGEREFVPRDNGSPLLVVYFMFIISTHKLVVSHNFLFIRIVLSYFYPLIFYFGKFST